MVLKNYLESLGHFESLFAVDLLMDLRGAESDAYLFDLGRVIFEVFVPKVWLTSARYGAHYLGVEYQADMDDVRTALAERGIGIVRDIGVALHTDPADTLGVAFEFYAGHFHDNPEVLRGHVMKPAQYWRDEHPLGLTGLDRYAIAVHDLGAARSFLESFLTAELVYEEPREAIAARAVGLRIADSVVELLAPTGAGPLSDQLARYGEGICSVVLGVRDLAQVATYFAAKGVDLIPGGLEGALALAPADNLGVKLEFYSGLRGGGDDGRLE